MTPRSISDIVNNRYVNHFDEIAERYGLEGSYIQCDSDAQHYLFNIYFACGLDSKAVNDPDIDVERLCAESQRQGALINTQIAVFKISDSDPLLSHQKIVEHCQLVEFLKQAHEANNLPVPKLYPKYVAKAMAMAHGHSQNPNLPHATRKAYEKTVNLNLKRQAKFLPSATKPSNKELYYLYGNYDSSRSQIYNWFKCHFSPYKTRVSLEHLAKTANDISSIDVRYACAKDIERELSSHREILYWVSKKPDGAKLSCDNELGYGSKEANDTRTLTLCCDREYFSKVFDIVNRHEHPDAYKCTEEQIYNRNAYVQKFSISAQDYSVYEAEIKAKGLDFCILESSPSTSVLKILVGHNNRETIESIASKVGDTQENKHLYTDNNVQNSLVHQQFEQKMQHQLEKEVLNAASEFVGSSDVEIVSSSGDWLHSPYCTDRSEDELSI